MNYLETKKYLTRYIKARIPVIAINTSEKDRIFRLLKEIGEENNLNFNLFQMSQGIINLKTNELISEEKTIMSALDFIAGEFKFKENCNFILSGLSDIDSSTMLSRYLLDVIELAEKKSGVIILCTPENVWNEILRIGISLKLNYPTEEELYLTIKEILGKYKNQIEITWDENDYKRASTHLQGLSEMEVKNIISSLIVNGKIRKEDLEDLKFAKQTLFTEIAGLEAIEIDENFSVVGLDNLQEWLNEKKNLMHPNMKEELLNRGLNPPRGILLTGVPGCGKSLCAKATSKIFDVPLYRLDLATVQGEYVGQSERQLKEALETAEYVSPCVLWIDEIEKGLKETSSGVTSKMIGQFLFWLQECKKEVFVVATANNIESLPAELIRKGRFDEIFFVDLPNDNERKNLILVYSRKYLRVNLSDEFLNKLVAITNGFSSADIESTIRSIAYKMISSIDFQLTESVIEKELSKVVSLSQTNPEKISQIREWGNKRAAWASR